MKKYKHIFFDLDHTLWDYDANARETLEELYDSHELAEKGNFDKQELVSTFFEVNEQLWDDYNHHRIDKAYIRTKRFEIIFDRLRLPLKYFPSGFGDEYIHTCPTKSYKIPHALEVLDYLAPRYTMHVITNGFNDIQGTKLKSSDLRKYFDQVITSESIGARKPSPTIFEHAMQTSGANTIESIMVGDNLAADILGAKSYGMDQIYFNPQKNGNPHEVTHEISSLLEIKDIL